MRIFGVQVVCVRVFGVRVVGVQVVRVQVLQSQLRVRVLGVQVLRVLLHLQLRVEDLLNGCHSLSRSCGSGHCHAMSPQNDF